MMRDKKIDPAVSGRVSALVAVDGQQQELTWSVDRTQPGGPSVVGDETRYQCGSNRNRNRKP